ncbi:MAG TPA: heavy-metal-associated domain-containing protein [Anaerovoracaceae bacterium]|nr:heavy-metal-associated domain-containing protein [Anaerovoracaceae bacterium]
MTKTTIQLEQITCPTCVRKIEGALAKTDGVESASVSFNTSKVKAEFDESKVKQEDIKAVIEKLGFEVLSVK